MEPDNGNSVPVATRALEYAGRGTSPPAPIGRFAFGAMMFGLTHWAFDCMIARIMFREWVDSLSRFHSTFWSEQFYELGLTAAAVLIAFGVQWAWWRARPVERPRRVGFVAMLAGLAYCAAGWAMYQLSFMRPFDSDAVQAAVKFSLAAGAGCVLAWWRGRGTPRAVEAIKTV
jgi:hypothetical protein